MKRLLILEPESFSEQAIARLEQWYEVDHGPLEREHLLAVLGKYDVIFVRLAHQFDSSVFAHSGNLKVVVSPTTGLNHIDVKAAEQAGVSVLSLRGEREFLNSITATAELTWGMLIALYRSILSAHSHVILGGWERDHFRGHELTGKTLGVVGYGRLGTMVASYGAAFGMKVVVCDVVDNCTDRYEQVDLDRLCSIADVVSLHVPSTPENHKMLGAGQFAVMKPGAVLLNTSRGDLVDERALVFALRGGHIAGAALDVLNSEYESGPDAEWSDELKAYAREHSNLIITPHIGGATFESSEKTELFMVEKLLSYEGFLA